MLPLEHHAHVQMQRSQLQQEQPQQRPLLHLLLKLLLAQQQRSNEAEQVVQQIILIKTSLVCITAFAVVDKQQTFTFRIALATILEEILPVGAPSWEEIASRFKVWAEDKNVLRPVRDAQALRSKYTKMLSGKPTGVGGFSAIQQRFQDIEKRTHDAVGGAILLDDHHAEPEDSSDLDEHALNDALAEVDGIETARTSTSIEIIVHDIVHRNQSTRIPDLGAFDISCEG
jgi:hypothetical protein